MLADGSGCRVRDPGIWSGDCRGADGFGKHEFLTLQYSDANTDRARRRKEVPCIVGTAVLEACSVCRQTFWYVPHPPAFVIVLLLIPTCVWTGNQPVQAFIDCHTDGKTWALLFDSRHGREIFMFPIASPPALQPTRPPTLYSVYRRLCTKVKILSHVNMVQRLRMSVVAT
jgi:hypothetical protein